MFIIQGVLFFVGWNSSRRSWSVETDPTERLSALTLVM